LMVPLAVLATTRWLWLVESAFTTGRVDDSACVCAWMSCSNHELKGETTPRASTLAHHEHEYAPISEEAGTLATSLWPLARGTLR
jgi:hypothetical protein